MKFFTIMPFIPSEVDKMAEEYKRLAKSAKLELLLPSMMLTPEGNDPWEKVALFTDAFGQLQEKLRGSGIRLGILLQSLIGHGWSSNNPAKAHFQVTINHTGGTRGRLCPLDENFLRYCREAVAGLARYKPDCFLLDDDTRLLDNDMVECFCPLHLAKFSRKYTQEELIEKIVHSRIGDPILQEFEAIRRNSIEDFCRNIRRAIDSVDKTIPCGISGPGREICMLDRMAVAAAGPDTVPFFRPGNNLYNEFSAKELPRSAYIAAFLMRCAPSVQLVLDESDTFPHNNYSKSCAGLHSHLTVAALLGMRGSKTWIANFMNPLAGLPNTRFEKLMADHSGFYKTLTGTVSQVKWKGVAVPLLNPEKNFHPIRFANYFECTEWQSDVLGRLGIPVKFCSPDDPEAECFAVTADVLEHLTKEEIAALFQKNIFADSPAAHALKEAGFGSLLGTDLTPCPHFTGEREVGTNFTMRLLSRPGKMCSLLKPQPGAEILTELFKNVSRGSTENLIIGPGTVISENRLGKKSAVWAGYTEGFYLISPERKKWLLSVFDRLLCLDLVCMDTQDIFFRYGVLPDGSLLAAMINLSYDQLDEVDFRCKKQPSQVLKLMPDGSWKPVDFTPSENGVTVGEVCRGYYPLILRFVS